MADKPMKGMPGMSMGDTPRQGANTDPTKNQKGMDTVAPPMQVSSPFMEESMKNMPMAAPKSVWTVTGTEDWKMLSGFGQASGMVTMMNEMMVGGSPMRSMKMGKMDTSMAEMPPPTPEQARMASDTTPAPATAMGSMAMDGPQVSMTIASGVPHVGDNTLDIMVTDAAGKPIPGATVTSTVAMTTMDMGTTHPAFKDIGDGKYQGKVVFSMAGPWRISLHVTAPGRKPLVKDIVFSAQ
jgi:hypothetical protein